MRVPLVQVETINMKLCTMRPLVRFKLELESYTFLRKNSVCDYFMHLAQTTRNGFAWDATPCFLLFGLFLGLCVREGKSHSLWCATSVGLRRGSVRLCRKVLVRRLAELIEAGLVAEHLQAG